MYDAAIRCGMTEHEFYHSTMKYIFAKIDAYTEAEKAKWKLAEYHAWLTGVFTRSAVWGKKYPDCPVKDEMNEIVDQSYEREVTPEEKQRYAEMLMARFEQMAEHHDRAKAKGAK